MNVEFVTFHRDDAPRDVLDACDHRLPAVVARSGGDLLVVLSSDDLEALGGDVTSFEAALKRSCASKGIALA
jgi:hypothetical protein